LVVKSCFVTLNGFLNVQSLIKVQKLILKF
jgi:hypothetical protein